MGGAILSFLKRIPFILEIRDIWPESIVAVGAMQNKRVVRLLEWLELKLYASATHIVTVGEGYKQRLLQKNVQDDEISIIPNGLDDNIFYPREKAKGIIEKYNLNEKFVCSYVGTIGMACGLEVVLRAAKKLKVNEVSDIHFLLVGDGASRESLAIEAEKEGLNDYISFIGRQPKELIPSLLATSDVCLIHLRKTDLFTTVLPSKIFEAAGMKRPLINGVDGDAAKLVKKAHA